MKRRKFLTICGGAVGWLTTAPLNAEVFQTPSEEPPLVHWAILESADGKMQEMQSYAARFVAPEVKGEDGTYALYGGVDSQNPNVLRLLEIYESKEAYEKHVGSAAFAKYRESRAPILKSLSFVEVKPLAMEQRESGTGGFLIMRRYAVAQERFDEYVALAREEARRATRKEERVLGVFVTAEIDEPNVVRSLIILQNENALDALGRSDEANAFKAKVESMERELERVVVKNAKVVLSAKGKRSR